MVEGHGWGELVLNWGRWEIFKVSLHSWQRGTPFFMKIPYITYPLFQILSTPLNHPPPPLHCPVTSNPYCPLLFAFSCFFDWMDDHTTFDAQFYVMIIMDLHMLSLATLIPEEPWCVFCAARRQVYWGLTHNVVFYRYYYLISHTNKHANIHSTLRGSSRLTHPYKYIFTPSVMCFQQLPLSR